MMTTLAVGVDLGGTNLRAGLVDRDGRVLARSSVETGANATAEVVVAKIAGLVAELKSKAEGHVVAVGCGVPGIVDAVSGVVHRSPNLPEWNEVPVRDLIAQALQLPLALDNDANMHALGEARFGAGKGHRNMVLLTLGSGIGGGLILNGEIFHGDCGFAGEVGHLIIEPDGLPCGCGGRGCWELFAGSRAFRIAAERLPAKERDQLLAAAGVAIDELTPALMASLADERNATAIKLWEGYGRTLGTGIASLLNVLGVETFVIGGGIARSYDLFISEARSAALAHTYAWHADHLLITKAILGDDAGIVGAAAQALALVMA